MNDDDLDQLLTRRGEQWRMEHQRVADVDTSVLVRRTPWASASRWVPLAAAAAVVAVLAVVVALPDPHRTPRAPVAGPSPSATPTRTGAPNPVDSPRSLRVVPLTTHGTSAQFVGDGRVVLVVRDSLGPGVRERLEIRPLARPESVSFSLTSAWPKGGDIACPSVSGKWLVYTDVGDEPTMLSPGPPEPWKLVARDLDSGAERQLASGMADMANEFACAVRDGDRLAWTSGRARQTSTYNLSTGQSASVSTSGTPTAFVDGGLLIAQYSLGPKGRALLVDTRSGRARVVASQDAALYFHASFDRLAWLQRLDSNGVRPNPLHLCLIAHCDVKSSFARVEGDVQEMSLGNSFLAYVDSAQQGFAAVRFNGSVIHLPPAQDVAALAAAGDMLVYVDVTGPATAAEKDALVIADLTPR